jgi:hypothetical protein
MLISFRNCYFFEVGWAIFSTNMGNMNGSDVLLAKNEKEFLRKGIKLKG